ncbi:MAG: hypothetical protein ACMXYD_00285 [Candidatus Woesearchaeota archaeon]
MPEKAPPKASLKQHFIDTTSLASESNPPFAVVELVSGMSAAASLGAKISATTLGYLGLASLYSKGRDTYMKYFSIPEDKRARHDVAYTFGFNAAFLPVLYTAMTLIAGEPVDPKTIGLASLTGSFLGAANGPFLGYAIDVGRDLTGLSECNRKTYPDFVKRQPPKIKKGIYAGLVAASIATLGALYSNADKIPTIPSLFEQTQTIDAKLTSFTNDF